MKKSELHQKLLEQKKRLIRGERPDPGIVRDFILRSWERSAAYGISMENTESLTLDPGLLRHIQEHNQPLIQCATEVLNHMFSGIRPFASNMALANAEGITIAAPGFYAPQGRWVRLEPQDAELNAKIESFGYHGRRITNFEMEGSALAGLAALMGHRAATICTIIAQRIAQDVNTDYKPFVRKMIETALDKLAILE